MPLETVEEIIELRETARYLYAGISAHVVIVSPCHRESRTRSHWVFDESFDCLESWNVPIKFWETKNVKERFGSLREEDMEAIWEWFHARRLAVSQVVFGYPDPPRF